jgi:hypothetical protein
MQALLLFAGNKYCFPANLISAQIPLQYVLQLFLISIANGDAFASNGNGILIPAADLVYRRYVRTVNPYKL